MQALILAGGEGTRLRPLTTTFPKPVVPLVDRPFIGFMLDWLRGHGVDEVIMGCGHMADGVRAVLGDGSGFGVRLSFVEEPRPLGTGGALKFAEDLLDERFLMLNGDVLTDLDLTAQIAQHEAHRRARDARADAGRGPVRLRARAHSRPTTRSPSSSRSPRADQIDTNNISAGAYVLERSVLELLEPGKPASIERDVFPRLVGDGLYGYVGEGYWMDIGTPDRYLQGTFDILEGTVTTEVAARMGDRLRGGRRRRRVAGPDHPVGAGRGGLPDRRALAGRRPGGARARASRSARTRPSSARSCSRARRSARAARSSGCIVGAGVTIGDDCHVDGLSVLGEGVTLGAGNIVSNGARIFPGVSLPDGAIRF